VSGAAARDALDPMRAFHSDEDAEQQQQQAGGPARSSAGGGGGGGGGYSSGSDVGDWWLNALDDAADARAASKHSNRRVGRPHPP
jgi:hypothetical protein